MYIDVYHSAAYSSGFQNVFRGMLLGGSCGRVGSLPCTQQGQLCFMLVLLRAFS